MEKDTVMLSLERYHELQDTEKAITEVKEGKVLTFKTPPEINHCFEDRRYDRWGEIEYYLTPKEMNEEIQSIMTQYEKEMGRIRELLFKAEDKIWNYIKKYEKAGKDKHYNDIPIEKMSVWQFRKWRKEAREKGK